MLMILSLVLLTKLSMMSSPKLMTEKFEMSMMGELKFFLGFEVKQLREGTFINQAKYTQDMLKRFKMDDVKASKDTHANQVPT